MLPTSGGPGESSRLRGSQSANQRPDGSKSANQRPRQRGLWRETARDFQPITTHDIDQVDKS